MKRFFLTMIAATALMTGVAAAADIGFISPIAQSTFRGLSKEAGMGLAYRYAAPPASLGITGFDAGVGVSLIDVGSSYWSDAFRGHSAPDYITLPTLRLRKGLPFGIDVGAMYADVSNTNIRLYGAELSKELLDEGTVSPALSLRASYTKLDGIDDLDIQTVGIDAAIGKSLLIVTPYLGGGMVWIDSRVSGNLKTLAPTLEDESIWQPRLFAGVEVKPLPMVRLLGEVEYALRPIYTLKVAIGF